MRAPANPPATPLGRLALSFVALMLATTLAGASAVADEPADRTTDGTAASELGATDDADAVAGEALAGDGAKAASDADPADGALAKQLSLELPLASALGAGEPDGSDAPATLAGYLASGMLRVSADVALAAEGEELEPVVGSFTVDGLTYAVTGEGEAALVAVSPRMLAGGLAGGSDAALDDGSAGAPSGEGIGSGVPTSPQPSPEGTSSDASEDEAPGLPGREAPDGSASEADGAGAGSPGEPAALAIPDSVDHDGMSYAVTAIGPRALAGCLADVVAIPASVASVDQAAFSGSSVATIEVAEGNPTYSSYDGMLFDADMTCLLLIPEGKQGAALVPESAEGVLADALSHSGPAEPSSAGGGGAAFSSRNGCLYDASGETLVWAPPGSEEAAALAAPDGDACEADAPEGPDGLPAASLSEAASSRANNNLTLNGGGGTIYKSSNSKLGTLTKQSDPATISCSCNKMKVRMLPGYPGAIHYRHGTDESTHLYYLWVKPGYKVTGFRDVANPGDDFALTETLQAMSGKARTLEPTWSPQSYSIVLDANGGCFYRHVNGSLQTDGATKTASFSYREGMTMADVVEQATSGDWRLGRLVSGYRLAGWRVKANGSYVAEGAASSEGGSTVHYLPDGAFSASDAIDIAVARGQSVVLEAQWDPVVSIEWDSCGGSAVADTEQVVSSGAKLKLPADPTRSGYRFAGWFTAKTGGTQVSASTALPSSNITYYAHWEENSYRLTFDGQGGTVSRLNKLNELVASGATVVTTSTYLRSHSVNLNVFAEPKDPSKGNWDYFNASRPGYAWKGWSLSKSGGSILSGPLGKDETIKLVADTTVYAQWEAIAYKLTFDGQGGTAQRFGTVPGTRDYFLAESAPAVVTTSTVLRSHSVNTNVFADPLDPGSSREDWFNAVRPGYSFEGWSLSESGGQVLFGDETVKLTADTTVYAQWEGLAYSVTLDPQGGSGGTASAKPTYGSAMPAVTPPTRAGYAFGGYFDQRDGKGTQYYTADGKSARSWDKDGDGILYARWAASAYKLTFDGQGGTVEHHRTFWEDGHDEVVASGPTVATTSTILRSHTVNFNVFVDLSNAEEVRWEYFNASRPGYAWKGWSLSKGGAVLGGKDGTGETVKLVADTTVYAQWEAIVYKLTFDGQGGTVKHHRTRHDGGDEVAQSGATVAVTSTILKSHTGNTNVFSDVQDTSKHKWEWFDASRPGYALKGWSLSKSGGSILSGPLGKDETIKLVADTTVYAQWQSLAYAISYDAAGGELPEGAREAYSTGDAFDLPAPTRYGYQFDGWDVAGAQGAGVEDATADDGSKVTRVRAGTYGDLACTARWTLRYDLDVPVADPGEVTFEADSLTGQVRVRPGTSAEGELRSYMAAPVALDSLACEGLDASGQPDAAGGAPELEAIFGAGSAAKVRFTATVGEGEAAATAKVTAVGPGAVTSLAGSSIPAATSHDAPGRVPVSYGLELDSGLAIPPVRDAAPVARLTWTVSLPAAGA